MNKKISQFEVTSTFEDGDILTLVQDGTNKIIHKDDFETSLSGTFATNERVDSIEEDIDTLDQKVDDNYTDLSNKIVEGDTNVTNNLTSNINEYYDVLNNKIITLEDKHDKDVSEVNDTVQGWIDEIDNKGDNSDLQELLNRIIQNENLITAIAEIIANGGGSSGEVPGFHTQPSNTIFPLSGYYKGTDASPLATTDTLNQALSKLENQVDAISSSSGSLPVIKTGESTPPTDNNIYTAAKVDEDYLRNNGDTSTGYTVFTQGIQGGEQFREGWDGVGASLWPLNGNKWKLEVDELFVRGNMTVNELTVNEIKAVGGDILVTLADMECTKVEVLSDAYRCYFDDGDGTKYNEFRVNDMAICQKFDGKNVKRYWRKVNAVGSNYIDLSLDICEPGSGYPEEGDNILQLGHMYESDPDLNTQMDERRNAIFISAKGTGAPRISFYKNIDDFTLADSDGVVRERVVIGGDVTKFVGIIYQTSDTGIVRVPVYQGIWQADRTYHYYDQVSHNGSLWICMNPNGTTVEPQEGEDDWQLQVSKGDQGQAGDDVAKWVEITGERLFLYEGPDFTGTPTPTQLSLLANTYGMTNPTYEWRLMTGDQGTVISQDKMAVVNPYNFPEGQRTVNLRCTVTDSTGSTYYDETQLAKLCNGAEGLDAYYIDLSNGTVVIPYDSDGNPKVELNTIYTTVSAYHGIEEVFISNIEVSVVSGAATVDVVGNTITLMSLSSDSAQIQLNVTLEDGVTVQKIWYIGRADDGEDGFNGTDASYAYMSGDMFFHYTSGSIIPTPTTITLTTEVFNVENPHYQWYWSVAGAYAWNEIENSNSPTLTVSYNGVYFISTGADEITFRCVVYDENSPDVTFEDMLTINNVRDGENVYRGALTNPYTSVDADADGTVTSTTVAVTDSTLKYGSQNITDYKLEYTQEKGQGSLTYDNNLKRLTCTALLTDEALWKINFITPQSSSTVVDSVDFTVVKNKQGQNGAAGTNQIMIYTNTSGAVPPRPTFSYRPAGSASSGGYTWRLDPVNSTTQLTWVSSGQYDPDAQAMKYDSGVGGYWTTPVIYSPLNGTNGKGVESIVIYYYRSTSQTSLSGGSWSTSVPTAAKGYYIWIYYYITYDDGSTARTDPVCVSGPAGADGAQGIQGPSLVVRKWQSGTTYRWTTNPEARDVVYYNKVYYAVATRGGSTSSTPGGSGWVAFNSFENIATGLLLAETATIAGWNFNDRAIWSLDENVILNGRGAEGTRGGSDDIFLAAGNTSGYQGVYGTDETILANNQALFRGYASGRLEIGNSSHTAGMSGEGSSDAIRFWAGSSYNSANTSNSNTPFRVYGNGELHAINADIQGTIKADAGYIGGFSLSNNWLSAQNNAVGSGGSYININNSNCTIQFGDDLVPSTAGGAFTLTGRIINKNNYGQDDIFGDTVSTALFLQTSGGKKRVALDSSGHIRGTAGISIITPNFGNNSWGTTSTGGIDYSDAPNFYKGMKYMNVFVFNPSSNRIVYLPTAQTRGSSESGRNNIYSMNEIFSSYQSPYNGSIIDSYVYMMTIVCQASSSYFIEVRGNSEAPIRNQYGEIHHSTDSNWQYGSHRQYGGRTATYLYFNRTWYILDSIKN